MNDEQHERLLLAVLDHYGLPEPRYGEHPMKCPAHDDRVASASINRGKGLWHCHACGAGGGAAQIVMAREGMGFKEASAFIAGITGESPQMPVKQRTRKNKRWVPPRLRRSA
jgi:DNA primase